MAGGYQPKHQDGEPKPPPGPDAPIVLEELRAQIATMGPEDSLILRSTVPVTPELAKRIRAQIEAAMAGQRLRVLLVDKDFDVLIYRGGPNHGRD